MDTLSPRLEALLRWREALISSGVSEDLLPPESDLRRIASHGGDDLSRLGLTRPAATHRFQEMILALLRSHGIDDNSAESQPAEPPVGRRRAGTTRRSRAVAPDDDEAPVTVRPADPATDAPPADGLPPFAPLDIAQTRTSPVQRLRSLTVADDGTLSMRWPPLQTDDRAVVYRIVTSDRHMPYSPESGDLLTATTATEAIDNRPFSGAMRYVQVWVNHGDSSAQARLHQPDLLCEGTAVAPVRNLILSVDHGTVTCIWDSVPPEIRRVEVVRVPLSDVDRPGYLREYLISQGHECRTGFHDLTCTAGESYEYRIFAVALVNGHETMSVVSRQIRLPLPLRAVSSIRATLRRLNDRMVADVVWEPPSRTTVHIYRTARPPETAALGTAIPRAALPTAGLPDEDRLTLPVTTSSSGSQQVLGVPLPEGWTTVYFTPVSLNGDEAMVGECQTVTQAGKLHDARLVQRGDWQLLTLDWPSGAASVHIYLSRPGASLEEPVGEPYAQMSRGTYDEHGGVRLHLSTDPCDIHVVPISYYGGELIRGAGVTVPYAGLWMVYYRISADPDDTGHTSKTGHNGTVLRRRVIELYSGFRMVQTPRMVLVHNAARLPLDIRDGTEVLVATCATEPGQWTELQRFQVDTRVGGYYRLFADAEPAAAATFALFDPPIHQLLGGP